MKRLLLAIAVMTFAANAAPGWCADLEGVLSSGKLRHLGIVYAKFVTEDKAAGNDADFNRAGLDVELIRSFAKHLGVEYEFVETNWASIIPDLTGKAVKPVGDDIEILEERSVKGDIVATGFTVLPWRKKIVDFSEMTFPTGVWLISRAESPLQPIEPTGDILRDIQAVKSKLKGVSVLGLKDSCLDPELYELTATGAVIKLFPADRKLDEMIPSVMAKLADTVIMDVPVALVALEKWPGEIKVVGPVSEPQQMACAFSKTSPKLREAFNVFFEKCKADGTYKKMVENYYPALFMYYPDFLKVTAQ